MQQQEEQSIWTTTSSRLANQQAGLAQNQFALSNFQRQNEAANVANLGQLGAFRQGLDQSQITSRCTSSTNCSFEPFQRLSTIWNRNNRSTSWRCCRSTIPTTAAPSPFSTALSTAFGIGGLFGKFR